MGQGRISLRVDSPLRDLMIASRSVPTEVRRKVNAQVKSTVSPIWQGELRERAATRLQQRALVNSGQVGVTSRNVFLRSGSTGRLSSGTPVKDVSIGAERGIGPNKRQDVRASTRRGRPVKAHTRRIGSRMPPVRRRGYVFQPAVSDSIPRITSLVVQTATKTTLDLLELKG